MNNRKIYHLVHAFPTFLAGGAQVRTSQIINSLPKQFRHTIIAMDGKVECRQRILPSVDIEYIESFPTDQKQFNFLGLKRLILSLKPDLLLTYNWGAIEAIPAGKSAGVQACLHTEDGFGADEAERFKVRRVWGRRLIFRLANGIVVPSLTLFSIAKEVWHVPENRIHYIPNGVSTDRFVPRVNTKLRQELEIKCSDCVFGTVAHLRPEKNFPMLIRSFAKVFKNKAAHLMLVGDGSERDRLSKLVVELGIKDKVFFIGHVEDTAPYYQAMDIFVLSSVTEQMPITVLEAMSSGLAVVTTDVGDIKKMVYDANRDFIFSLDNEQEYRKGLLTLFENTTLRKRLGEQNRKKAITEYSLVKQNERYRNLYERYLL